MRCGDEGGLLQSQHWQTDGQRERDESDLAFKPRVGLLAVPALEVFQLDPSSDTPSASFPLGLLREKETL